MTVTDEASTTNYDMANRLLTAPVSVGAEKYMYGADNKRISTVTLYSSGASPTQTIYIYGAMEELLTVLSPNAYTNNNVYFAGRMIKQNTDTPIQGVPSVPADLNFVLTDRVGSVRGGVNIQPGSYFPYGENQTVFATYYLDANTGLHYADQRFYSSVLGRFTSADRFRQAAKANDSASWNKYLYTRNNPVNSIDPHGSFDCFDEEGCEDPCDEDPELCGDPPIGGGPPPGGGGSPPPSSGCMNWGCLPAALAQAEKDLSNPDCASIFHGHDPFTVLQDIASGTMYGTVNFTALPVGIAANSQQVIAKSGHIWHRKTNVSVTININTILDSGGTYWNNGVTQVNALTLLHELGHAFNQLFGSGSSSVVYDANPDGSPNSTAEAINANILKPCNQQ